MYGGYTNMDIYSAFVRNPEIAFNTALGCDYHLDRSSNRIA